MRHIYEPTLVLLKFWGSYVMLFLVLFIFKGGNERDYSTAM